MRVIHRVVGQATEAEARLLCELADTVEECKSLVGGPLAVGDATTWIAVRFVEGTSQWSTAKPVVSARRLFATSVAEFTAEEIAAAPYCALGSVWMTGYPEPRPDENGFLEATFKADTGCASCGAGITQIAPFRMRRAPRFGRRALMQLNWVFGTYFTTPAVFDELFRPRGARSIEVLDAKGRSRLDGVVQLVTDARAELDTTPLTPAFCPECSRVKYLPYLLGPFTLLRGDAGAHVLETAQWFGSGAEAHRMTLLSAELVAALRGRPGQALDFTPVRGAPQEGQPR